MAQKQMNMVIRLVMMKSDVFLGESFMTLGEGGSVEMAIEAKVSMMRLIHSN